jgi:hypothetical protein
VKRILLPMILGLLMTGCATKSYNPEAQIDIRASTEDQRKVIETTKAFGIRLGFKVHADNQLVRDGRHVEQVFMERSDGVVIAMGNFLDANGLQTTFHAKSLDSDWRSAKEAWLQEVSALLSGRGEIVEVPVGPEPSLLEKVRGDDP